MLLRRREWTVQKEVSPTSLKALFCSCNFETSSKTILDPYCMSTLLYMLQSELVLKGWGNVGSGYWGRREEQKFLWDYNLMGWSHTSKVHSLLMDTVYIFCGCNYFTLPHFWRLGLSTSCEVTNKIWMFLINSNFNKTNAFSKSSTLSLNNKKI
jgi:hypothetical protein